MWKAMDFADRIGLSLNYALTLHLEAFVAHPAGSDTEDRHAAYRLLQRFQSRARHWMERRGCPLAAIWVREAEGSPKEHVHLAVHIPSSLVNSFGAMLPDWIGATHPRAFLLKPVKPPGGLKGWFSYMVKGGDDLVHAEYGVRRKDCRDQGRIVGKRTGMTTAINSKAQTAFKQHHPLRVASQTENTLRYLLGRPQRVA